jgi:hypothetical protein
MKTGNQWLGGWSVLGAMVLALCSPGALAQNEIALTLIPGGPTGVSAAGCPPGDPNRMFVLNRSGTIRILNLTTGEFLPGSVVGLSSDGSSNGVTGLAFHPGFATNGYFYLWRGISVVRLQMSGDPLTSTTAPSTYSQVISISTLQGQHVGGWIGFGPDGMLWVSTGDAHNSSNGQRTDNLMGRILRLDVDGPDNIPGNADDDAFPTIATKNYCIPPDNPFVGIDGEDEIWAYGLRNPYRCSFDMHTGEFWIGDVGEGMREEINFQPQLQPGLMPGAEGYLGGRNYGWSVWEGTRCHATPTACGNTPYTPPVAEYPLSGNPFAPLFIPVGSAVIGGYVYYGCSIPSLRGWFIFGDAGSVGGRPDFIWALRMNEGVAVEARQLIQVAPTAVYGFAQDTTGEMYVCGQGGLYKIGPVDITGRDVNQNGILDSCEPGCGADFDGSGQLDPDDLADFITCFFLDIQFPGFCAAADYNHDGFRDPDDLADFITRFFTCL